MSLPEDVLAREASLDGNFSYTFRQIIDADHLAINRLAGKIRKILASTTLAARLVELNSLLLEITWRLIRHDFSEDVVMRPAFASVLGETGADLAERDRADHVGGRDMLLSIKRELEKLEKEFELDRHREGVETVAKMVKETFDELGEHMRIESGQVLPRFESIISRDMSMNLARQYANTLVMTPDLTRPAHNGQGESRQAAFIGGVNEYIRTPPAQLKQLYERVLEESSGEEEKLWFDEVAKRELEKIQVDKGQKSNTVVEPEQTKEPKETSKIKVPTNALGLPISWHSFKKAKL